MRPFTTLTSRVIPLLRNNIDTDQIIPARFLKVTGKQGLADGLFAGWRYQPDGKPDPEFPLNRREYQESCILLAGDNFGCGSSREHAPWALVGWGIRAILSTSFADIFRNNALKNGLLPVILTPEAHTHLTNLLSTDQSGSVTINLEQQSLHLPDGSQVSFPIDSFNKSCLLQGVDQLGFLMQFDKQITAYEQAHKVAYR